MHLTMSLVQASSKPEELPLGQAGHQQASTSYTQEYGQPEEDPLSRYAGSDCPVCASRRVCVSTFVCQLVHCTTVLLVSAQTQLLHGMQATAAAPALPAIAEQHHQDCLCCHRSALTAQEMTPSASTIHLASGTVRASSHLPGVPCLPGAKLLAVRIASPACWNLVCTAAHHRQDI